MNEEELKKFQVRTGDYMHIVSIAAEIIMEEKGEDKESIEFQCGLIKKYCPKIRQSVADLLMAYKDLRKAYADLQGRIKGLADQQELSYKEHIKRES